MTPLCGPCDATRLSVIVAAINHLGGGVHDFKGKSCVCFVINETHGDVDDIKIHGVICMVFFPEMTNVKLTKYATGVVFSVRWRRNHCFPAMK